MEEIRVAIVAETVRIQEMLRTALQCDGISVSVLRTGLRRNGTQPAPEYDAVILGCETAAFFEGEYMSVHTFGKKDKHLIAVCGDRNGEKFARKSGCDFLKMTAMDTERGRDLFARELIIRIKVGNSQAGRNLLCGREDKNSRFLVGIGSSAGGPKALLRVLKDLPADTCGILLVQHLSSGFARTFAQYMDLQIKMKVKEAETGEIIQDGTVYLASDGCQMSVGRSGMGYVVRNTPGEKVNGFAPSVNYLFSSLAGAAGENAMGMILTGMGDDGAKGLLEMKNAGACTVVQDRRTSEIYNMPSAALELGGAQKQLPLDSMAGEIRRFCIQMRDKERR
ncbi:CheB methylesterase domain-containing protein [Clostridium transplantifaecale]|uniref:CheB methylesterase domain-containing protein n=1 Tax=Clostridium transplantifaecale TaxID=2479838 RepID=UPI0013DE492E|nr:CheB methylesterase domain-containing protein [Clostridium transplantifaecale]